MKKFKYIFFLISFVFLTLLILTGCENNSIYDRPEAEKPVIYLYPTKTMEIIVELDFNGTITCSYPTYDDGWTVTLILMEH